MAGVGLVTIALARGLGPGVGGTALAAYATGVALAGPVWGRSAGIWGVRRVMVTTALGQLAAFAVLAFLGRGPAAYGAGAALLGLTTPPVMAIMRATWSRLFARAPSLAHRMAVVETMNTEVGHILGRTVVAALAALSAWIVPFVYMTLTFVAAAMLGWDSRVCAPVRGPKARSRATVVTAVVVAWAAALGLAALSHGLAATAMLTAVPPDAAWRGSLTMAVWGLGSLLGGAAWLIRPSSAAPSPRLVACWGLFAFAGVASLLAWTSPSGILLQWALIVSLGLPIAPVVSAVFEAAGRGVGADRQVEVFAALNSVNLGCFALGSVVGGWVVEAAGEPVPVFLMAALASVAAAFAAGTTPRALAGQARSVLSRP